MIRSGLEVYGPRSLHASVPDESVMPAPATPYGASLLAVEAIAAGVRARHGAPACARCATRPSSGRTSRARSGRLLRLPAVPVPAFADPPFSLLHPDDAAEAMVAAIERRYDGPLNVVGPGAATPWQAVRLGGRVPVPVLPPFWRAAARLSEVAGAAIAPHVVELLRHGRTGSSGRAIARARPHRSAFDATGAARAVRVGRTSCPIETAREAVA